MSVVVETTAGDFTVDLFLKERPRACQNFLKLCKIKYYNFSLFHCIQRDFIAQTGDPTGSGKGGSSLYGILYGDQARYFEAERTPKIKHRNLGTVSFASHGKNLLGSQFFVTLAEALESLDDEHCVFGQVVEGMDVLAKLNDAICDQNHQPYQDIRITHTVVLDDPLDDPSGLEVPDMSPQPTADMLKSGRIGVDEEVDDTAGLHAEQLDELVASREAAARATILEMVGDLPDAQVAPPENVLFVCKLNPVTTDDDLKIIFSRFGKIVSCEIIRDQRTGNSLQYGFIEFDNPQSCESAYFKMDNVLIDDRRIHVDFSQSVSRIQWKGRGRVSYKNGADMKEFGSYSGRGGSGRGRGTDDDRGEGIGNGKNMALRNPGRSDGRSENVGREWDNRDNRNIAGGGRGSATEKRYNDRNDGRGRAGLGDRRRRDDDNRRVDDRSVNDDRPRGDRHHRTEPARNRSRSPVRSRSDSRKELSRDSSSHRGQSIQNVDRELASRLDVKQLKALLGKDTRHSSSETSGEETPKKASKKDKYRKRSKRKSSSDSDTSSDRNISTAKQKKHSKRQKSASPEARRSKSHKAVKKIEVDAVQDRKRRKDRERADKPEKRSKKKKKIRQRSSSDNSSSSSNSSEPDERSRKKSKKKRR